jgi:rSAM/selenodomain-associated transferase 1
MPSYEKPTVCILTKPPVAGEVKTRLVPCFGEAVARDLACSFLVDTVDGCRRLTWARTVVATTFPIADEVGQAAGVLDIWDQGGGDLGSRIERVLKRALKSSAVVMLVGADSPGLPNARLEAALDCLKTHDSVLGPAEDGGFYLLGLKRCPDGLLADLPWSRENTCEKTASRLKEKGLSTAFIEPWFDVDRAEDAFRLYELLKSGEISAPATYKALERILRDRHR